MASVHQQSSAERREGSPNMEQSKSQSIKPQNPISNQLNEKYIKVSNELRIFRNHNQQSLAGIEAEVSKCQTEIKSVIEDSQSISQKQQLSLLEKQINTDSAQFSQFLKQAKRNSCENIFRKFKTIKSDAVEEICMDFDLNCRQNYEETVKKIDRVAEILQTERTEKEEAAQYLISTFGDQIIKLEQLLTTEKSARIASQKRLMEAIRKIEQTIDEQSSQDQEQKLVIERKLQAKLQDVCTMLESKALGMK